LSLAVTLFFIISGKFQNVYIMHLKFCRVENLDWFNSWFFCYTVSNYLFYFHFLLLHVFLYLGLMGCWKINYYLLFIYLFNSRHKKSKKLHYIQYHISVVIFLFMFLLLNFRISATENLRMLNIDCPASSEFPCDGKQGNKRRTTYFPRSLIK
jgi:hypothetical protein